MALLGKAAILSQREAALDPARHRMTLELHIGGQAVAVGRVILAANQRCEIAAAGRGDAESIGGDEIARNLLLAVGDRRERRLADAPPIGLRGLADDDRQYRVLALDREFDGGLADRVGLLNIDLRG